MSIYRFLNFSIPSDSSIDLLPETNNPLKLTSLVNSFGRVFSLLLHKFRLNNYDVLPTSGRCCFEMLSYLLTIQHTS